MLGAPQLHITQLGRPLQVVEITHTITIGRADDNDIVLADLNVSRWHAVVLTHLEHIALIDLDSTNGTFVNGVPAPADQAIWLADGDQIMLGPIVQLRYHSRPGADRLLAALADSGGQP